MSIDARLPRSGDGASGEGRAVIDEPMLTVDLENGDDPAPPDWHPRALRELARQLTVRNDYFYPLLGAAQMLEERVAPPPAAGPAEGRGAYYTDGARLEWASDGTVARTASPSPAPMAGETSRQIAIDAARSVDAWIERGGETLVENAIEAVILAERAAAQKRQDEAVTALEPLADYLVNLDGGLPSDGPRPQPREEYHRVAARR